MATLSKTTGTLPHEGVRTASRPSPLPLVGARRIAFGCLLLCLVASQAAGAPSIPVAPEPAPAGQAVRHQERAAQFFSDGRYREALAELRQARKSGEDDKLLFNLALTYWKLGRLPEAHAVARQAIRHSADANRRKNAQRFLAMLETDLLTRFGRLIVECTPTAATLTVDGKSIAEFSGSGHALWLTAGPHVLRLEHRDCEPLERPALVALGETVALTLTCPLRPARLTFTGTPGTEVRIGDTLVGVLPLLPTSLAPGAYVLKAAKEGYALFEQSLDVAAGEQKTVNVEMKELAVTAQAEGVALQEVSRPRPKLSPWGFVTAGIGSAIVVAGGALNAVGRVVPSEAKDLANPRPDMTDEERKKKYDRLKRQAQRNLYAAYGLYAVGSAAIGAGLLMEVLNFVKQRKAAKPAARPSAGLGRLELWQPPGLLGAGLSGRF